MSPDRFYDLFEHAKKSGMYYCSNFSKTSGQIRKKLYEKGYPVDNIVFQGEEFNIVDEVIKYLEELLLIDDESYAESYAKTKMARGHGETKARAAMLDKGLPKSIVEKALEKVYGDSLDELKDLIEKQIAIVQRNETDFYKIRSKVFKRVVSRGWGFQEASEIIDELLKDFED